MKATLIFETQQLFVTKADGAAKCTIEIRMDLYKLAKGSGDVGSDYRFSWIAFDSDNPMRRVLFDTHPPKGPHVHLDDDAEGEPFKCGFRCKTRFVYFAKR